MVVELAFLAPPMMARSDLDVPARSWMVAPGAPTTIRAELMVTLWPRSSSRPVPVWVLPNSAVEYQSLVQAVRPWMSMALDASWGLSPWTP